MTRALGVEAQFRDSQRLALGATNVLGQTEAWRKTVDGGVKLQYGLRAEEVL